MAFMWLVAFLVVQVILTKEVISGDKNVTLSDLETRIEALESKIKKIDKDKSSNQSQVLLYVTLSASMTDVSNHVTLIFDTPLINTGNHYNENDGIYISPFTGKLLVSWTIGTDETAKTELMVEDRAIGALLSAASSVTTSSRYGSSSTSKRESSSSTIAVVTVEKGDHVFLRTASDDNHILKDVSSLLIRALY